MTPPRDRHPFGWLAVGAVFALAVAGFVGLLVWDRWVFLVAVALVVTGVASWWVPNRGLRAELEAARYRLSTYNGSETHEALAEVGPVTGQSNVVALFDGSHLPEWREQAGPSDHLGQACGWSDDGLNLCGGLAVVWGYFANGERVWLCAGHEALTNADDPTGTRPRSLGGPKVSD